MKPARTELFDTAYAGLNPEQKQAVDTIDGPVFVVAGPGTGKTQILTLRIANILRLTDTPPDAILALTFTDSAIRTLRERLVTLIGDRGYKVRIHTFHSFAQRIVNEYPDAFPRIIGSQLASDTERAEIMEHVLLNAPVEHLRPFGNPLYYQSECARAISTLKRERTSAGTVRSHAQQTIEALCADPESTHQKGKYLGKMKGNASTKLKKLQKTLDLASVYEAYEAALATAKRYDYDDVVLEVAHALEQNVTLRIQVQESVQYVLADEHQDANRSQNALLEYVSDYHEQPNLFIVGDEKQAIYRFQGADLDNVHYFRKRFPGAVVIALVENYRSSQPILDSALSLITASPDARLSRVPLIARAAHAPKPPILAVANTPTEEMYLIAQHIREALAEGIPAEEIAILLRRNTDVDYVEQALIALGIGVSGGEQSSASNNRFVRALLRALYAVAEPTDANVAQAFLLPGFTLSPADLQRAAAGARKANVPLLALLQSETLLQEAGVHQVEKAMENARMLTVLATQAAVERPAVVAEAVLQKSGILPLVLRAADRAQGLSAIRALFTLFESIARQEHDALLPRALETLARMEERGIKLPSQGDRAEGKVRIMTVHKAKGREFTRVFIPLVTARSWSIRSRAEHFDLPQVLSGGEALEDERRLLYVAITRAKEQALISYATTNLDGRDEEPAELISDLDSTLITSIPVPAVPESDFSTPGASTDRTAPSEEDRAALRAAFWAHGLSATALNNFLACPWRYFYENLLRLPTPQSKHAMYGDAIHRTLKYYADQRLTGTEPGVAGLHAYFTRAVERTPANARERLEQLTKGTTALTLWWESRHASWPEQARGEEAIATTILLPNGMQLPLKGSLDLIVRTGSGAVVTDYKTGRAKTANEIKGTTTHGDGAYYRQLTFYKLLLAKKEVPEIMTEGAIEFMERDAAGELKRHTFAITEREVIALEATIADVAERISTFSFWNDRCDDSECSWCQLRAALVQD